MYFRLLVWVEISSFSLARFSLASDIGASFCFPVYKGTPKPCWFLPRVKVHDGRRQWQATPVLLPRKSHGWRSLVGCSPWGRYKSDATEWLHFHFSLSHNGEGNGNPLQCSCLENPRDRRAWWAAVYSPWGHKKSDTTEQLNNNKEGGVFVSPEVLTPAHGFFPLSLTFFFHSLSFGHCHFELHSLF